MSAEETGNRNVPYIGNIYVYRGVFNGAVFKIGCAALYETCKNGHIGVAAICVVDVYIRARYCEVMNITVHRRCKETCGTRLAALGLRNFVILCGESGYFKSAYGVAVAVEKSVQIFNGCISCREVKVCGKQIDSRRIVVCKFCVVFFNGTYFLNIYLLAVNLRRNSSFAVGEPVVYGVSSLVFIFKLGSYRIIGKVNS